MFDDDIMLDGWGRVFLLRRWAVRRLSSSDSGPMEIRRGAEVTTVPGHCVRQLSETGASSLADDLLNDASRPFGVRQLIESLGVGATWTREEKRRALARALADYVLVTLEDERGRWDGPAVQRKREEREPATERPKPLTWVGFTVVDDDDPARPLAGARFQLRLPDAATTAGKLDGDGHARVDDIHPGKCWLELTEVGRELSS